MERVLRGLAAAGGVTVAEAFVLRDAEPDGSGSGGVEERDRALEALADVAEELGGGGTLTAAVAAARAAAEEGMRATVPLQASKGRASYLGERSIGHQDPGATSSALIIAALERTVAQSP